MAEGDCFEGRWVGNGDRAVYLQRKDEGTGVQASKEDRSEEETHFELHEGLWAWVEHAPEGEDPRETLARGEILERRMHALNELCILLAVPVAIAILGYPLLPTVLLLAIVVAIVIVLLIHLPRGRGRLLAHIFLGPAPERRKARELAALGQLDNHQHGVTDSLSLDELEKEFAYKLAYKPGGIIPRRAEYLRPATKEPEESLGEDNSDTANSDEESHKTAGKRPRHAGRRAPSGLSAGRITRALVLLSLVGHEKNFGDLLAHIRAFSGTVFAPGPTELGMCLRDLEHDGFIRQTGGEHPFARYKITPDGGQELHAKTPLESDGRVGIGL
jgi:hypothetical protein